MDSSRTLSLSDAIKKSSHDILINTLMNHPEKRAKVLELLTQEGIVRRDEKDSPNSSKSNKYHSPVKRLQKNESTLKNSPISKVNSYVFESPSALGRRRALERLESDSSNEDSIKKLPSPPYQGSPKPFDKLLEGVIAFCEIRKDGEDRSATIKTMMRSMGAIVKDNLCKGVTHVILKDSLYTTYRKAKILKVHVVSVLWLEAVRKHKYKVPESKFPAVCADAYDADITKICEGIEKDYNDVIQDELNNTPNSRISKTPLKFITERKKSRATIHGNSSLYKEAHNRTELASPYKFQCNNSELSDSDSYISVGSNHKNMDIVPCSQEDPTYMSINHNKTPRQPRISEEDIIKFEECNLGKIVKDSFELKKASEIRSPESLNLRSRQKSLDDCKLSTEEESLKLRVSITDDSNLNSTKTNSRNLLENVTLDETNLSKSSINNNLIDSSIWKKKNKQCNIDSASNSSLSSISTNADSNKSKTRRRTTVGLKRPAKNITKTDDLNKISEDDRSDNTNKISENKFNTTENDKKNSRRKTMAKINTDNNVPVKRSKRNTLANIPLSEDDKSSENKPNEQQNQNSKKSENTSSDSSADKSKRRVRKLYDPNQVISESQINWDENVEDNRSKSDINELPKLLSNKAEKKVNTATKSTRKSVAVKTKTQDKKRKSVRILNFESTSSETSDKEIELKPIQTPSRKSVRLMKTPVKKFTIPDSTDSDISSKKEVSDTEITNNVTPRKTKRILSSQESDKDTTPRNKRKTINTPNIRRQLLKNKIPKGSSSDDQTKTDDESKRRSTLDFIQKKDLDQIRSTQKTKQLTKLPSIVCTKLHKSDVQIFQQIVKKLGCFIVEDEVSKRTTHVVAASPSRTINMLRAIARGCWILRHEWLYKSLEAGKWIEEEDYEMVEFSPSVQKCRLERQTFGSLYSMDLFISCGTIYISRASIPRFSDIEELVKLCGGRIVRSPIDAQIVVAEHASQDGVVCVTEKWILDSITFNKLKKYKLYVLEPPKSPEL